MDDIIAKAREASAQAGAAVFSKDFDKEATKLAEKAEKWLTATALFGLAALCRVTYQIIFSYLILWSVLYFQFDI